MPSLRLFAFCAAIGAWGAAYGGDMVADQRLVDAASLKDVAAVFAPEGAWQHQNAAALGEQLREVLASNGDTDSVFLVDADLGPLSKALLVVLNEEPMIPHARYRLRYAQANVTPEASPPLIVELVEVSRFNLGPARHAELVEILGEEQVASVDAFGQASDVSWRLITRPIMGQVADITYAARRELPEDSAEKCLGLSCQTIESLNDAVRDWPELEPAEFPFKPQQMELSLLQAGLEQLGLRQRDEQGRTSWRVPEWPESVTPGEPFIEVSLERGMGQDDALDLVIHHDQLMDDHTRALWERLVILGTGDAARVVTTRDQEPWPRPDW